MLLLLLGDQAADAVRGALADQHDRRAGRPGGGPRPAGRCRRPPASVRQSPRSCSCSSQAAAPGWPSALAIHHALGPAAEGEHYRDDERQHGERDRVQQRAGDEVARWRRRSPPATHAGDDQVRDEPGVFLAGQLERLQERLHVSRRCCRFAARAAFFCSRVGFGGLPAGAFAMSLRIRPGHERPERSAAGADGLLVEAPGPVGRADQRPAHDAGEADLLGLFAAVRRTPRA